MASNCLHQHFVVQITTLFGPLSKVYLMTVVKRFGSLLWLFWVARVANCAPFLDGFGMLAQLSEEAGHGGQRFLASLDVFSASIEL